MSDYLRPDNLEEALASLSEKPRILLAGGTDFFPARVGKPINENVLDITGITSLRTIEITGKGIKIGALTTWSDIVHSNLPPAFNGLKKAAITIGGIQTQNAATICGNICNASPAADSVPNLMALEAKVKLQSLNQTRILKLEDFLLGNRKTARKPNELVSEILIPSPNENTCGNFEKLGARAYLVISIVMVGAVVELDNQKTVVNLKIAVGSCSPVAKRLRLLEKEAVGQKLKSIRIEPKHINSLKPIDDIRATANYRANIIPELLTRVVKGVVKL